VPYQNIKDVQMVFAEKIVLRFLQMDATLKILITALLENA
jgi:hypothetical protein